MKRLNRLLSVSALMITLMVNAGIMLAFDSEQSFMAKEELLKLLNRTDLPLQSDFPDESAVILYEKRFNYINPLNSNCRSGIKRIVKIFDKNRSHRRLQIKINPNEEVISFNALITHANGETETFNKEILTKRETKNSNGDVIMLTFSTKFPQLANEDVLEYNYVLDKKDWMMGNTWEIQDLNSGKLYVEFAITAPEKYTGEFPIKNPYNKSSNSVKKDTRLQWYINPGYLKINQEPELSINEEKKENLSEVTDKWIFKDVPRFIPDSKMPPYQASIANMTFRFGSPNDWDLMANYFSNIIYPGYAELPSNVKDLTDKIIEPGMGTSQKINAVKSGLSNFKTLSYSAKWTSFFPSNIENVIESHRGTSQDKASLLIAMLRKVGMNANPAFVVTRDENLFNSNFCAWNFDKILVYIDNGGDNQIWIDPDDESDTFDRLPWQDNNLDALVIYDDGTCKFKKTTNCNSRQSKLIAAQKVAIISPETAQVSITFFFTGYTEDLLSPWVNGKAETSLSDYLKQYINPKILEKGISGYSAGDITQAGAALQVSVQFNLPLTKNSQSGSIEFPTSLVVFPFVSDSLQKDGRRSPVMYKFPFTTESVSIITYQEDKFSLEFLPNDMMINGNNIHYDQSLLKETKSRITIRKSIRVDNPIIQLPDYPKLWQSIEKMNDTDGDMIRIKLK